MSGFDIKDLDLSIAGDQLTVSAERKEEYPEGTAFHRQERGTGNSAEWSRFLLRVDADKVEASLKNGVLTIRLPKAEAAKPKKIQVSS